MTTEDEIKAEYTSSLADLTFNSKPLINVLTMLAEENLPNARIIVEAIEEHLSKVATDVKLPILYLIDCIVKNVGQTYTGLFSQNIVSTFCSVFKMVDEKTRSEMFKLRQTWNDVFPQMKLYAIDVQISTIDPAWPVTAQPSNSIHLNPKFLKNTTPPAKSKVPTVSTDSSPIPKLIPADIDKETLLMQEQLIQKQKELLELQKKTLELEVLQTQVKLQEQIKSGGPPISTNILLKPEVAKQLIPEAITKTRPPGIANSVMNQRLQNNVTNQPRINPVNPALATAKPIRDPRLLRQQQQQQQKFQQQQQKLAPFHQNQPVIPATSVPAQKTAVLENNKIVTNKQGVRDIPKDPRLSNKADKKSKTFPKSREPPTTTFDSGQNTVVQKGDTSSPRNSNKPDLEKASETSPKLSSNSSNSSLASTSSSSLGSPSKSKSRSPNKHKKRNRPEGGKREKVSPKSDSNSSSVPGSKNAGSEVPSTFKSVKSSTKNRNYMRRNMRESPVPLQDEDLRSLPIQDNTPRVQPVEAAKPASPVPEPVAEPPSKPMDIDLRQLPQIAPPNMSKKRTSTEASDQASKKSRSFDVLFGSEDTDLRQLPVTEPERMAAAVPERPPTPPPPIISSAEKVTENPLPQSPKKADLDAIRAKLANATNRDKVMLKSFHKNKIQQEPMGDQDLRVSMPKAPASMGLKSKIMISPEEEKSIKSGQMTKEQEKHILNKIFMQIEKDKLREAKIKDHEESLGDISLQPISDDEFGSDPEENVDVPPRQPDFDGRTAPTQIPPPPMPFNDKDERLNIHHMASMPPITQNVENIPPVQPPPFYPRGDARRHPFRGSNQNWRGRGRNMPPQGPPQSRQPIRPWLHQQQPQHPQRWRNPGPLGPQGGPFIPQAPPEFIPVDDEASRSPGQDFGSQELTLMQEEIKTLNIDGVPRDIRVYNETAIIFLSWDDPREISFQSGVRRIIFNNNESYILTLGDEYKECLVNGFPFRVKLGAPSRELFINDIGFECFFGGAPIHITINGINMTIVLEGPPPQVKIGDVKMTDLVVGKINLIINAKLIVPVFLDGKLQKFVIEGQACTLKFVDSLKRVLINDVPFNVEFGGLPKPFTIHGKKHFIRFSVLPKGVKPGFVKIRDMEGEVSASPIREDETSHDVFAGPLEAEPLRPDLSRIRQPTGQQSPDNRSNSPSIFNNILQPGLNNFDVISNVFSQSLAPTPTTGGYEVELPGIAPTAEPKEGTTAQHVPPPNPININELFQKLVASGFVKTQESKSEAQERTSVNTVVTTSVRSPIGSIKTPVSNGQGPQQQIKKPQDISNPLVAKPQRRTLSEILRPITFARPETLKIRQAPLYSNLYTGMQCSSCGMRFSPESSMLYSQHLDWHFRQNRKGKKNARVANSRRWYYSLADWKNYEEIEDLEEREKNYFDQQQQAEVAEEGEEEAEVPSVPADPGSTDEKCYVCRDAFEQFFNEEKEEWHLRNAIKMNDKTYHPVCYDDYQQSILDVTLDDSKIDDDIPQPQKLIPGLEIILDDDDDDDMAPTTPNEIVSLAGSDDSKIPEGAASPDSKEEFPEDDGDDDDVILNEVAPIKIVVDDDDDDQPINEPTTDSQQSVGVKKEKHVEHDGFVDVDGFLDVGLVSLNSVGKIKIKSEPVDDDDVQSVTLDTSRASDAVESQTPEVQSQPMTSHLELVTSHPQLITSIDGNVELVSMSAPPIVPTTISGGAKIKINISKPLPVITPKEGSEISDSSEVDVKSNDVLVEELEILRYKPALQNVPLKKLAPVKKGTELTGLCSIM